jgi:hypothetical protein
MIEELLIGPWNRNGPAAPQKLLNAYIKQLSGFSPLDCDGALLAQEPDVKPSTISIFEWQRIKKGMSY